MHLIAALVILFTSLSFSNTNKVENTLLDAYSADAKVSASTSDLYRSYKLYLYLYENHKDYFFNKVVSSYITNVRELASAAKLKQICDNLSKNANFADKVKYRCAFELFHINETSEAKKYLTSINSKAKEYPLGQILLSSIYLGEEDHKKCLANLSTQVRTRFEAEKLEDIYYLTRARCQAKAKLFTEAIVSYQSVSSKSRYYFDALSELSWVFFKVRDVELVRNTVKVIQASFKNNISLDNFQHAHVGQFYFSKYLLAYLDLVVYGNDQKEKFSTLENEITNYINTQFVTRDDLKTAFKDIELANSYSELQSSSLAYQKIMYHFSQWLPSSSTQQLTDAIRILIAVNKENQRFANKIYSPQTLAERAMRVIKAKMTNDIKVNLASYYDVSLRTVNGFRLKVKIGEVDLKNLGRTEGLKNLDEATTIYKEKENSLSQKMGIEI